MGTYTMETIENDFKVASHGLQNSVIEFLVVTAKATLQLVPDNEARELAISHLLLATTMVWSAYVLGAGGHAE